MTRSPQLENSWEDDVLTLKRSDSHCALCFLTFDEKYSLQLEKNCQAIFETQDLKSVFCLKPYFYGDEFARFLKALKQCFEEESACFISFRLLNAKKNQKWVNIALECLVENDNKVVKCSIRDATSENIQNYAQELCLKLWELHSQMIDMRELNEVALQGLKDIFYAPTAFSFKYDFKKAKEEFFIGQVDCPLAKEGLVACSLSKINRQNRPVVFGSDCDPNTCGLNSSDVSYFYYEVEQKKIIVLGLVNSHSNLEQDFFEVVKKLKGALENIFRMQELNEEKALSSHKMRVIAETAKMGLWDWDLENDTFLFDDVCFKFLGYEKRHLPTDASLIKKLVHPLEFNRLSKAYLAQIKGETGELEIRTLLRHKSGEYIPTLLKGKISKKSSQGKPLLFSGMFYDMSNIENMEKDLKEKEVIIMQQEKLALLGELAASVAHEIKSPLTIVAAATELMKLRVDARDEDVARIVKMQEEGIARIVKVLAGLRSQTMSDDAGFRNCELNDIVSNCLSFLTVLFAKSNLKIEYACNETSTKVSCDPMRIQQVIMNLITNAKQAIGNSDVGRLIVIEAFIKKGQACVGVKDFGKGVSLENADKIFGNYFSTKKAKGGTGLGLPISKKIMLEHGGDLILENPGQPGARFVLSLPLSA
ncbi:MAG: ATP-binding protein [Bacteriovoracaceae bacterium]